ncbi:MAG: NAD(+) diphosphatase [Pseudolabrys sp.]|nr:NAD(+) diphosphatase [Pseudolabrys sp.]
MHGLDLGPKPRLGYVESRIDRAADKRHDDASIAAMAASRAARAYVVCGELIAARKARPFNEPLFEMSAARALGDLADTVFLGLADGAPRFGIGLAPTVADALKSRDDLLVTDLRSIAVQGLVAPDHLPPIAEAKAVLAWHLRHRFCSNCGAPTRAASAGWRRDCPQCQAQHFPRTDPVVIMLAVDGGRCVLARSPRFAAGMWSCLAGFVEPGEAIEDAVRRETREEVGLATGRVRYFASQPWPFPMSLMIGCHAEAMGEDLTVDRGELEDARWFSRDEVASMLLRRHPRGLTTPPPIAIAHHIIRAWIDGEAGFG